ncbi:MAG: VWA domain-containing protein [Pyrinomonadaceae bacterium]
MKFSALVILISFGLFFVHSANGQAGRGQTAPIGTKANKRPAQAEPTPTPPSDVAAADDGNAIIDGDVVRVETNLVTIPVRVVDRKGRFVPGLVKEQFSVAENNVPQSIEHFSNENQSFTVALVLDMSYSATFKVNEIQLSAISFIDQLRPVDKVIVISFDKEVHVLCDATTDREKIYRAINRTKIESGSSVYDAVDAANDRLKRIEGRKAIIFFTDGVDTTSENSHLRKNLQDVTELEALVYPIRYDTFADVQAMKDKPIVNQPGNLPRTPPAIPTGGNSPFPFPVEMIGRPSSKGTSSEEYAAAEEFLNQLALRSGGRTYVASTIGSLDSAFAKIASELREFYSLGYYRKDEGSAGSKVRLKVKVNQPDVAVRARDSYVISDDRKENK